MDFSAVQIISHYSADTAAEWAKRRVLILSHEEPNESSYYVS